MTEALSFQVEWKDQLASTGWSSIGYGCRAVHFFRMTRGDS
jgi:hypothetical protein